jgi:hypothetical protein
MARDHFSQMYKNKSVRHDSPRDGETFDKDFGALCGMLYSIVTLKAFFPKYPVPEMNNNPVKDANGGDSKNEQLPL